MSDERLDVLVVGGGAREHALVSALARSPRIGRLIGAPGNPGIEDEAETVAIGSEDMPALIAFAEREKIDLIVVGPEGPLVAGLADQLRDRGFAVFGPGADGARLEGSKSFAKQVMEAAGVPTPHADVLREYEQALAFVREHGVPMVIKADGLAAGKGVIIAKTVEEAEAALSECFVERRFGDAAGLVLLEEYLEGEEVSFLSIVSGDQILPLAPAQDYKRIFDRDGGPNTGGMGSYCPVPAVDDALYAKLVDQVAADRRGVGATGHRLSRCALRRPDADRGRPEGTRIQLPLRRPRNPGGSPPAEVRPARSDESHGGRTVGETAQVGMASGLIRLCDHGLQRVPGRIHHRSENFRPAKRSRRRRVYLPLRYAERRQPMGDRRWAGPGCDGHGRQSESSLDQGVSSR